MINTILEGACTGKIGDGNIFLLALADCLRIRTGENITLHIPGAFCSYNGQALDPNTTSLEKAVDKDTKMGDNNRQVGLYSGNIVETDEVVARSNR